jgi:hypothetical protein
MLNNALKLTQYQRLTKSMQFLKNRASYVSLQFTELACYPEVIKEQAYINYCVSSATIPLLQETIRCAKLRPEDPLSKPLISYMEKHIPEEEGHDTLSLDDLVKLGGCRETAINRVPPSNVTAMIGSQYHLIRHNPVAFMGYLACLEVNHPTVEYVEKLIETSGLPSEGFSSLMLHATIDIHHKQEIIETLNALPLTEKEYKIVEMSAFQTYRYVSLVMEDICRVSNDKCFSDRPIKKDINT